MTPGQVDLRLRKAQERVRLYRRMGMTWCVIMAIWMLILGGTVLYAAFVATNVIERRAGL